MTTVVLSKMSLFFIVALSVWLQRVFLICKFFIIYFGGVEVVGKGTEEKKKLAKRELSNLQIIWSYSIFKVRSAFNLNISI